MKASGIKDIIPIDQRSSRPKYLQVTDGVIRAIEQRQFVKGEQLPSLRKLSGELGISFDTAKKAYDFLKKRNIIVAAQGKSNVVNTSGPIPLYRIFLLFNKLGSHKRLLYDAFSQSFKDRTEIDLHVYNNDLQLFRHLLETKAHGYTHYVIIPHLSDDPEQVAGIIDKHLGGSQLMLLNKRIAGVHTDHACVYEDFGKDIYHALAEAKKSLKAYSSLQLVYPDHSYYPPEIRKGFEDFCAGNDFAFNVHTGLDAGLPVRRGDVFIVLSDDDLARIIQKIKTTTLRIGKDVGIISYNETPLKEVLLEGITTISTDFRKMGELAAEQLVNGGTEKIAVPIKLTLRKSL